MSRGVSYKEKLWELLAAQWPRWGCILTPSAIPGERNVHVNGGDFGSFTPAELLQVVRAWGLLDHLPPARLAKLDTLMAGSVAAGPLN